MSNFWTKFHPSNRESTTKSVGSSKCQTRREDLEMGIVTKRMMIQMTSHLSIQASKALGHTTPTREASKSSKFRNHRFSIEGGQSIRRGKFWAQVLNRQYEAETQRTEIQKIVSSKLLSSSKMKFVLILWVKSRCARITAVLELVHRRLTEMYLDSKD